MFSEFLQKRKDLLVSLVLPLLLALGAAGLFARSAAADTLTGLTVEQVTLEQGAEGRSRLTAELTWNGEDLRVAVDVE